MEDRVVVDTDVIVDFLRGAPEGQQLSDSSKYSRLVSTAVNAFELYYGAFLSKASAGGVSSVKRLLDSIEVLSTTTEAMLLAGRIGAELERKGKRLEFKDLLIGCIALNSGFSVLTRNAKDFQRIPGLKVIFEV